MTLVLLGSLGEKRPGRWVQVCCAVLLILAVAGSTRRAVRLHHVPGPRNDALMGFGDFHNGSYFPATAFASGVSPYGAEYAATYPVPRPTPLYSPLTFLLHMPYAAMPLGVAEWVNFAVMLGLLVLIAHLILSAAEVPSRYWLPPLLATMAISRPVGVTLVSGYFTLEVILGVILAVVYAKDKPWLAAVGFALASQKPNFAIPLIVILFAAGHWRAVWRSIVLAVLGAVAGVAWLLRTYTLGELVADMQAAQHTHRYDATELPIATWTRLDLTALISKWTNTNPSELVQLIAMFAILAIPAWLLWTRRRTVMTLPNAGPWVAVVISALLVGFYHHSYDAMLVFLPLVGVVLAGGTAWRGVSPWIRWGTGLMLLVPLYNITATRMFMSRTVGLEGTGFQVFASINVVALVLACVLSCVALVQATRSNSAVD